ncbi:hypothetical protein LJC64_01645 [Ruminococcaceae bacterium OttesenSCG-928-A11]|nr:hypothetical protein [Ruminococcaceae bacterium OttesenSCG-928-A11]
MSNYETVDNKKSPKNKIDILGVTKRWFTFLVKVSISGFKKVVKALKALYRKIKKLNRPWKIGILAVFVIVIAVIVFFVIRAIIPSSPDERLRQMADDYYTEKIVTSERRSTSYTLVLSNMKKIGYDVTPFESAGCSLSSYAVIYLSNPKETDIDKIDYHIDTKLVDCE